MVRLLNIFLILALPPFIVAGSFPFDTFNEQVHPQITKFFGASLSWGKYRAERTVLTANKTREAITIDGYTDEASWKTAEILKITVQDGSIGKVRVAMRALYDNNNIYIHAIWDDPTIDNTMGKWIFDLQQGKWMRSFKGAKHEETFIDNEDGMAFLWNIDDSIAGFNIGACAMLCHGDRMHTNYHDEKADSWHWKASRTNPIGYMDDKWIDNTVADGQDRNALGSAHHGDDRNLWAGIKSMEGNYIENVQKKIIDGKKIYIPWYWEPNAEGEDLLYITQDEIEKGEALLVKDLSILDTKKTIPGYILFRPVGSRGDIDAKGVWENGRWRLEIKRRLTTAHKDDVQFDTSKTYRFGIAVMDNTGGFRRYGEGHSFALDARTLEFNGAGSEEITKLSLILDYLTTARSYIGSENKGFAYSEINSALILFDSIRNEVATKDPVLYLEIKNRFVDAKRRLLITDMDLLIKYTEKAILTFQGKRMPYKASIGQKLIIVWVRLQGYVFVFIALYALYPIYKIVISSTRPSFKGLFNFLFVIVVPLILEGIGRLGVFLNIPSLQNLSFMTSETATFIWAILMLSALIMAKRGFREIEVSIESLEKLGNQLSEEAKENSTLAENLKRLLLGTVKSLSSAIDAKSHWTKGHSERVTKYAMMIGNEFKFDDRTMKDLMLAGLLHDIGKIGIFEYILNKPDKLTEEEFNIIKQHPEKGAEILKPIKQFKDIIPAIHHHHEHYNGNGYPDRLKGEEIPMLARILSVADAFDAMTSDRPYRKCIVKKNAIKELKRCSGTQFDPEIVEFFLKALRENSTT